MGKQTLAAALAAACVLSGCEAETGGPLYDGDASADTWDDGADGVADSIDDGADSTGDTASDTAVDTPADGEPDGDPGPLGFIGSPCASDADCAYDGGVCMTGAPAGMCSSECDLYCPDLDGHPTTFCVDGASLPAEATPPGFTEGACFSRCDYGIFPGTGCREGYGCATRPRANEPDTTSGVCVPGEGDPTTPCMDQLIALGVSFEPSSAAPEHPADHPELTCMIEEPLILHTPVHGVEILSYYSGSPSNPYMACNAALALVRTIDDLVPHGVVAIRHMGTYNCRVIAGTSTLSRHSYADAIDLGGFDLSDGTQYTLEADWEHDTETPAPPGGEFLHSAAHRWYDAWIWNVILTPNYNSDHDDHFHVDMTPGSHFTGLLPWSSDGRYIGPAPYDD